MPFEYYVTKQHQRLRCGYTTGTCAALAAGAAARMLFSGAPVQTASLITPAGVPVSVPVCGAAFSPQEASCAVQKDGGDDPDVTSGLYIYAAVRKTDAGITIDGGEGVGRVTQPGLSLPVGAAAINAVPRRMIAEAVQTACDAYAYRGGLSVEIRIPGGQAAAQKTFNPRLGIAGGLSILGTSGIVEPMSEKALLDSIAAELRVRAANGTGQPLVLCPGNYGEAFVQRYPLVKALPEVKCSNFIGDTIDLAIACGFQRILLVGHFGKLVKLAGGIMNTHSHSADCRMELICAHAACCGAAQDTVMRIMQAVTTDAALAILQEAGLRDKVLAALLAKIDFYLAARAGSGAQVGAAVFHTGGLLGMTVPAKTLLHEIGEAPLL